MPRWSPQYNTYYNTISSTLAWSVPKDLPNGTRITTANQLLTESKQSIVWNCPCTVPGKKMLWTSLSFLTFQCVFIILAVEVSANKETLYCCGNFVEVLFPKILINLHRRSSALWVDEAKFTFEMTKSISDLFYFNYVLIFFIISFPIDAWLVWAG